MTNSSPELWDIYDGNKRKTGRTMRRNDWNMAPGDYHLSVLGIITDPQGLFLITQRKADKQWAPLHWEVPGGGVMAGETSLAAVQREVQEETGLDPGSGRITFLTSYRNDSPQEKNNYFEDIYHLQLNFRPEDVHLQQSETEAFRLVSLSALQELGEAGVFLHYQRLLPSLIQINNKTAQHFVF